jgi:predicted CoA-substrate-specific enzyme activase
MYTLGLDVGSTTVKAILMNAQHEICWQRYERHQTRQLAKVRQFLQSIEDEFNYPVLHICTTGSGGKQAAHLMGVRHYQEVNALGAAVKHLHTNVSSVFELGGQDSKYINWRDGEDSFVAMNDRCAGGTGATIDRIVTKLGIRQQHVRTMCYDTQKLYPVAGKCGVFAETDLNSLQKQGVSEESLLISLFNAIVEQNLAVLARGHMPAPPLLLLGGPNVFFPALKDAWKARVESLWRERHIAFDEDSVSVPTNALYYGAHGAALLGSSAESKAPAYSCSSLIDRITESSNGKAFKGRLKSGGPPLLQAEEERRKLAEIVSKPHEAVHTPSNKEMHVYIGVDGGSTSTKGVVLDAAENVIETAYMISKGNPVEDTRLIIQEMYGSAQKRGFKLDVRGIGFTGYAKDLLSAVYGGDTAIVETVAHTLGALKYYPNCDVVCDVGGQDIKIILLKNGSIRDFRLNTQCSAGNGYYLQSTADRFGYSIDQYAEAAFSARTVPDFNFGCAVFLEADIVNFQQIGWTPEEIMAGLARVLPLNVWLYVVREPNLSRLGKHYVLQGGTHNNLAVVKAQHDFIKSRVKGAQIHVHPYNEVAGAIGAAIEARRALSTKFITESENKTSHIPDSSFIGFDLLDHVEYSVQKNEKTRCRRCGNRCLRTLISVKAGRYSNRHVIANCTLGSTIHAVPASEEQRSEQMDGSPNFVQLSNSMMFEHHGEEASSASLPRAQQKRSGRNKLSHSFLSRSEKRLAHAVIGIPRVLGMYSTGMFFRSYFETLGAANIRFSRYTSPELYKKTAGRGSIDPCFPSKIAIAHVYDLMNADDTTHIFFPCIRMTKGEIHGAPFHWACTAVSATPQSVKASFTLNGDEFQERDVRFIDPVLDLAEWDLFERQLYNSMRPLFGISRAQNRDAMDTALYAWDASLLDLQSKAERVIMNLENNSGIGIVLLGRPYHNDPGVNHGILDALNRHGYPLLTIESLPRRGKLVERLFEEEIKTEHAMDIRDIWSKCYSENTSLKIWAAKFTSRHPNLIALDLSSFRCGHDAPLYSVLDDLFSRSASPYFTFHEIDENRPESSIRLRVESIHYFLQRYHEDLIRKSEDSWQRSLSVV